MHTDMMLKPRDIIFVVMMAFIGIVLLMLVILSGNYFQNWDMAFIPKLFWRPKNAANQVGLLGGCHDRPLNIQSIQGVWLKGVSNSKLFHHEPWKRRSSFIYLWVWAISFYNCHGTCFASYLRCLWGNIALLKPNNFQKSENSDNFPDVFSKCLYVHPN